MKTLIQSIFTFIWTMAIWNLEEGTSKRFHASATDPNDETTSSNPPYVYDVSYPMLHNYVSTNYPDLPHNIDPSIPTPEEYLNVPIQTLGNRQEFYENYMQGCRDFWTDKQGERAGRRCDMVENDRIKQNAEQVPSMRNYTTLGYHKINTPQHIWKPIKEFWEKNKGKEKIEDWFPGNTFVNYWDEPSVMVNIEDTSLEGGGFDLRRKIWDISQDTIQEWTKQNLVPTSLYGVRVYKEGAVLAPHVDRLPLISSAIINVDQDVDEPWPLEVVGHDGIARNVTMEPGDMVLYESHSVIHGRPFAMKGRYFANVFIHFEPDPNERDGNLPDYILEGTSEAQKWHNANDPSEDDDEVEHTGRQGGGKDSSNPDGQHPIHSAAGDGDFEAVIEIIETPEYDDDDDAVEMSDTEDHINEHLLDLPDRNGWTAIHEAVRSGHLDILEYLVGLGADYDKRTSSGYGPSPLYIARDVHGDEHPVVEFLEGLDAVEVGHTEL